MSRPITSPVVRSDAARDNAAMRRRAGPIVLALFLLAALGAAPLATLELPPDLALETPSDWLLSPDMIARQGFFTRPGTTFDHALHPSGSRVSDLPYALVERAGGMSGIPNASQMNGVAQQVTANFAKALSPPSKADRPPAWTRSTVSPVRVDARNARFEFEATLSYDSGGDRIVRVAGLFGPTELVTLTIWSDAPYADAHANELGAMQSSFRFAAPAPPPRTMADAFLSKARWLMAFVILGIVGLQIFVLVRERRERRDAGVVA